MKFMWPTRPTVGFSAASPVITRLPPLLPAAQAKLSFAWLSEKSCSTLICGMEAVRVAEGGDCTQPGPFTLRRPALEYLVQRDRRRRGQQALALRLVAEHLRELRQDLQMPVGRLLRHEQREDRRHPAAVGR